MEEKDKIPGPMRRRLPSLALLALTSLGGGIPVGGSTRRYNVTQCIQCRAEIGPGRDGRRCKACREKSK